MISGQRIEKFPYSNQYDLDQLYIGIQLNKKPTTQALLVNQTNPPLRNLRLYEFAH